LGRLSAIPLLHQPGEAWLYNTCSDLQGVLVARASGTSFADFLAERVFTPLEMTDTSFQVPSGKVGRLSSYYRLEDDGLTLVDHPLGQWSQPIAFCSGAGGLVSTVDDWLAFARMLLADGQVGGRALLSRNAVRRMITDHLTPSQRLVSGLFLEGQGWGYGGSVDIEQVEPWNVAGRYGWVGGTGTTAHLVPATGMVSVLLTQVEMSGPTPPAIMRDFWDNVARG
jgi:CubicO group peptidase (beta-lactamase class C family)